MFKLILKRVFITFIVLVIGILIYGTLKQSIYDSNVVEKHKPEGKFADLGINKIHYKYSEQGNITFVLIAGLGESMHTWSTIESELNKRGRVFMYDRSGLGFSEEGVLPRSVDNITNELHLVLEKEEIPGPYVFIGHSAGAFAARYYAKKYPDNVLGLFLIDPYQEMAKAEMGEAPFSYRMTTWSFRNMAWSGIPFFMLPKPPHPIYKTSKAIKTYGLEGNSEDISLEQFAKLEKKGPEMPLYLLKADRPKAKFNDKQKRWSEEIYNKYSNPKNRYILIESGHHIHIQKPQVVLEALDEFTAKLIEKDS